MLISRVGPSDSNRLC